MKSEAILIPVRNTSKIPYVNHQEQSKERLFRNGLRIYNFTLPKRTISYIPMYWCRLEVKNEQE